MPQRRHLLASAVIVLLLALVPLAGSRYAIDLTTEVMIYALFALSLNVLIGFTGNISFGHAAYFAIGGYACAILLTTYGWPLALALPAAVVLAGLVAAVVGYFCVRLTQIYFAMLTLAFAMLFHSFLLKFYHLTGGDEGMRVVRPALLGVDLAGAPQIAFLGQHYYYYAAAVCLLGLLVMGRIVGSPFGLGLRAIRENPEKAAALGVDVGRYRWAAFVVSAVYAGVGGALLGPITGQVDPGLAYWIHSGNLVFMTLLGGFTHFLGPVVGAFVFIHLQDQVMSLIPYWRLVFGVILAALVIFVPGGLMSLPAIRPGVLAARPSRWRMTP
jgi:branched-chain amino acid transport system permease protein